MSSRPIKFRALHKPSKKYLSPDSFEGLMRGMTVAVWPEVPRVKSNGADLNPADVAHQYELRGNPFKIKDLLIEQFTGLTDKNGKEIYFGDIVKSYHGWVWLIVWDEDHLRVDWKELGKEEAESSLDTADVKTPKRELSRSEVIGNIHENPELLK